MTVAIARDRMERARALCREKGWDSLLAYGTAWRNDFLRYITDFPLLEGHGVAILDAAGAVTLYLESPVEAERASVEAVDCKVVWAPELTAAVARQVRVMGNQRVGYGPPDLVPEGIARSFGGNFENALDPFIKLLTQKTDLEVEAVRRAVKVADEAYKVFMEACRIGRREYEVMADFEAYLRSQGCPENFQIMASGGVEVRGMHPPGERRLQMGDLVTTECTPVVDGYFAQLCRTLVIGPPSREQLAAHAVYEEAMLAGIATCKPGVSGGAVAKAENDVFRKYGLGEYCTDEYTRVRGHGVGMYLDNYPVLLEETKTLLTENTTLIVHPNTYHPVVGYVVYGDTILVHKDGPEVLTRTPRKLASVPG